MGKEDITVGFLVNFVIKCKQRVIEIKNSFLTILFHNYWKNHKVMQRVHHQLPIDLFDYFQRSSQVKLIGKINNYNNYNNEKKVTVGSYNDDDRLMVMMRDDNFILNWRSYYYVKVMKPVLSVKII